MESEEDGKRKEGNCIYTSNFGGIFELLNWKGTKIYELYTQS